MLKIEHITAAYHAGYPILKDASLEVSGGECIAILGRNGAGKTTFANSIFGLVPFLHGQITYKGADIRKLTLPRIKELGLGYFMQGAPVFPQMSVKDNLLLASGNTRIKDLEPDIQVYRNTLPILADAALDKLPAGSLSGGERTQLAIAMALLGKPSLLILDEAFAGLSPSTSKLVMQVLEEYQSMTRASIILIAQDRQMASSFCDIHYVIRDGKIV